MTPDLSVIVVNYANWEALKHCLVSLEYLHDDDPPKTEVIVVDNASPEDRLAEFATLFPAVRFIANQGNFGFANGCNLGAAETSGRLLLFLNPDSRDPGQSVRSLWQFKLDQPENVAIVSCRQIDDAGKLQKAFGPFPGWLSMSGPGRALLRLLWPRRYPRPADIRRGSIPVDWVSGSALMINRETLAALDGWWDGFWMYSEDVDLCRRAQLAGYSVVYTAEITLVHSHGGSSRINPRVRGLTRAETAVSRHHYASRRLDPALAAASHLFLFVSRYLAKLPAKLWQWLTRRTTSQSISFDYLTAYYRGAIASRSWISPRSVRHPDHPASDETRSDDKEGAGRSEID